MAKGTPLNDVPETSASTEVPRPKYKKDKSDNSDGSHSRCDSSYDKNKLVWVKYQKLQTKRVEPELDDEYEADDERESNGALESDQESESNGDCDGESKWTTKSDLKDEYSRKQNCRGKSHSTHTQIPFLQKSDFPAC
ncbi:MAG: hypothetical protein MMC33_001238 [Icmadophila ericetorum]|nr:hypothetical protein [Icmadophila ericetorum]